MTVSKDKPSIRGYGGGKKPLFLVIWPWDKDGGILCATAPI